MPTEPTTVFGEEPAQQKDEILDDNDSDIELANEIIESALENGARSFDCEDWLEAEQLYDEALQQLQRLPARSRSACDTFEL